MRQAAVALLGLVSALPLLYGIVFVIDVVSLPIGVNPPPYPGGVDWHLVAMGLTTILLIWYLANVFTSRRFSLQQRILWAVALFVGNVFVFSVFWYLYVWKDRGRTA